MPRSMLRRARRHVGSNLVAYTALFLALGGSASADVIVSSNSQVGPSVIAGSKGPSGSTNNVIKGSIGTLDLAQQSVTVGKVAQNAVTTGKIADGQVQTNDLASGAVTSDKLAQGAVGTTNIAAGAVTADKLGSDVQAPIRFSLSPTSGNPLVSQDVQVGAMDFTMECSKFGAGDPQPSVSAIDYTDQSELDLSWISQSSGGSPQPQVGSWTSSARTGQLVFLSPDQQGQVTIVWHDSTSTVTGTMRYLADATHCEASGQLNRTAG